MTDDQKVKAYGLFKQGKEGDNNLREPPLVSGKRAQYDAWESMRGMSKENA